MVDIVAVLGLGIMGGRVAGRLAAAGHTVTGYDPATAARDAAAGDGVAVTDSAEDAVADAAVAVLSLPGPAEVTASVAGPLAGLRPGGTVIDLSTIDPDTARAAHRALARHGVEYVDAPILGRPQGCGRWTVPAGGDPVAVDRARALLEGTVAARVRHVGPVGAGATVKVANNLMFGAINAVTAEAFTLCRAAGVDPAVFAGTVADSGAATVSGLFRELAAKIIEGDYTPAFELRLLLKDNRLALRLAEQTGSPAFLAGCVDQLNAIASRRWPHADTAAMYKLYQELAEPNPADRGPAAQAPADPDLGRGQPGGPGLGD